MSIEIHVNTGDLSETERVALVGLFTALAPAGAVVEHTIGDVSVESRTKTTPVLAVTPVTREIKVGAIITDASGKGLGTVISATTIQHTAEIEQLAADVGDTQSAEVLVIARDEAGYPVEAIAPDLAAIFGGIPSPATPTTPRSETDPVWPFPPEVIASPQPPALGTPASTEPHTVVSALSRAGDDIRNGVTLDKNGLPWDARIHASSKAINADGTWRAKKMVEPSVVAAVTAELRATMGAPAAAVHATGHVDHSPETRVPLPAAPAAPAAPAVNPLQAFLKEATGLINTKRATSADMMAAANSVGLPSVGALTQRPDLIDAVRAAFMAKVTPV